MASSSDILSALFKPDNNPQRSSVSFMEMLLSIQNQLSEIQENQRRMMKAIKDLRIEQRTRLGDIKKTTQALLKETHSSLTNQLNELQDSMDEQFSDEGNDDFDFD